MNRSGILLGALVCLSAATGLSACDVVGPAATPAPTCGWTVSAVDTLSKPSSLSSSSVVVAALIQVDGVACRDMEYSVSAKWYAPSTFADTYGIAGPSSNAQICAIRYGSPSVKLLDELHPDAVQPAIAAPDTWSRGASPAKGWVSWAVEKREDCWLQFSAGLTVADYGEPPAPLSVGDWSIKGTRAMDSPSLWDGELDKWFALQDQERPNWSTVATITWDSLLARYSPAVALSAPFSADESRTYRIDWRIGSIQTDCSLRVFQVAPGFVPEPTPTPPPPGQIQPIAFPGTIMLNLQHVNGGDHGRSWAPLTSAGRLYIDSGSTCETANLTLLRYDG